MARAIFFLLILVAAASGFRLQKRDLTFAELAEIDEKKYLENKRAVQFQIQCIVYDGPCDPVGKLFKKHVKAALLNHCVDEAGDICTPENLARVEHVISHVKKNYPEAYNDAWKKYLPDMDQPTEDP